MDTNAQWLHSSWPILLKRVNIRVRGFHLVAVEVGVDADVDVDVLVVLVGVDVERGC